jgi:6-phosphogluconolactonase
MIQHHGRGRHSTRQAGPHAHMIAASPDGGFVLATDLGTDEFLVYHLDYQTGHLNPVHNEQVKLPAGSGPRHFSFHPNGRFVYVNGELDSTLTTFEFNPESGNLNPVQHVSTLPDGFVGASTGAEIAVHPSGKYIYASNRGHDSIAIFLINQDNGKLHPIGYVDSQGRVPRSFTFDSSGEFILVGNQDSDNIITFRIDLESGQLNAVDECALPTPVCILCLELD